MFETNRNLLFFRILTIIVLSTFYSLRCWVQHWTGRPSEPYTSSYVFIGYGKYYLLTDKGFFLWPIFEFRKHITLGVRAMYFTLRRRFFFFCDIYVFICFRRMYRPVRRRDPKSIGEQCSVDRISLLTFRYCFIISLSAFERFAHGSCVQYYLLRAKGYCGKLWVFTWLSSCRGTPRGCPVR